MNREETLRKIVESHTSVWGDPQEWQNAGLIMSIAFDMPAMIGNA